MEIDIGRDQVVETIVAGGIVAGGVFVAVIVAALLRWIVHRFTHATRTELDDRIVRRVRGPFLLFVLAQAVFIALLTLSYLDEHRTTTNKLWLAAALLFGVVLAQRIAGVLLHWYATDPARRPAPSMDRALPLVQRLLNIAIISVGSILVLDELGISVGPLVAGLGIGGLAVALAVQPILASFFAGSSVLSDASIGVGDFIEVEGGPNGWVEDIGWRATRIRNFDNNHVIIPNSKLAESIVTNFDLESSAVGVPVTCGVAYEEDLVRVEATVRDELANIVRDLDEVDKSYEPVFVYLSFGDSNVGFLMKLQANERGLVGVVTHEMIRRVHSRFAREGITINYPARRLLLQGADTDGLDRLVTRGDARGEAGDA